MSTTLPSWAREVLVAFEAKEFQKATHLLEHIASQHPSDEVVRRCLESAQTASELYDAGYPEAAGRVELRTILGVDPHMSLQAPQPLDFVLDLGDPFDELESHSTHGFHSDGQSTREVQQSEMDNLANEAEILDDDMELIEIEIDLDFDLDLDSETDLSEDFAFNPPSQPSTMPPPPLSRPIPRTIPPQPRPTPTAPPPKPTGTVRYQGPYTTSSQTPPWDTHSLHTPAETQLSRRHRRPLHSLCLPRSPFFWGRTR